ncbi:hypothetical protein FEZ51_02065 [Pediococcus stilesii]|uniref:Uncharacterized protein n=1 Tax=Pediococcus stilesii TaxID=331679 RepID=A0A5R9BXM9_9LACO|nr:hypothetical protein [Pediococcus stilesii]TLQ05466.1 hypothetical protein FEZ51_02065 [Pediococcus stilesii]
MKIFLSGLESNEKPILNYLDDNNAHIRSGLMSYYYLDKKMASNPELFEEISSRCDQILIDSGAHSFQTGKKVSWVEYTKRYAEWIKRVDNEKILGYFEMDVDNIIGYDKVLELRAILEKVTDKIIPVWHKNRGIEEFKKMVQETRGNIIALTGFKNEDIRDDQFSAFVSYAHKHGKKVHCLGMTRNSVLRKILFDYVDSSSWKQGALYGNALVFKNGKIKTKNVSGRFTTDELFIIGLKSFMQLDKFYNAKWSKISHDLYKMWWFAIAHLKLKLGELT